MPSKNIRSFTVLPTLPERLQDLTLLAYNLWWVWNSDARSLFRRIDNDLFDALDHSPIRMGYAIRQARLTELANDGGFLAHLDRVSKNLRDYMSAKTWFQENYPEDQNLKVAYFSMEFGIHESVPVYSGGLGVLAGDHLKSASDLGLPLVGVSLMYREGYFRQYLNTDGWQQELYPENDFFSLPLIAELGPDGEPLVVSVSLPGRELFIRIWRIQVGRVPLYLLDANIPQNRPEDRTITAQLYGGDQQHRLEQEIVLGIGGMRALKALGITPSVCHMNEGHAAFSSLERVRQLVKEKGLDFATAYEAVKAGTVFTTHTPVPAGNDAFPPGLIDHFFTDYIRELGIDRHTFLALGRQHPEDETENFGMTVLAIRMANSSNGVSALHGDVSRRMWNSIWPTLAAKEVPIGSITNGIHTQTWIAADMEHLFERYVGVEWVAQPTNFSVWKRVELIPDEELWRAHERCRQRLVTFARQRLKRQLQRRGAPPADIRQAEEALDPDALTIGFARRFATYKRGDLVFRDMDRLVELVNNTQRPVQFIFAGKAHPRDNEGKALIARVVHHARQHNLRKRVVFIEDYDMNVARHLVHGVDIWLNNPRRPLEASGTSGMKVVVNGGLNLSILDGWWCEGYNGENGWAIGAGEEYSDLKYQDDVESRLMYEIIEREIVPAFYDRGPDGLPRNWIRRMKKSITTLLPVFNTNRMVSEYLTASYLPAHRREMKPAEGNLAGAANLARWRKRIRNDWANVRIVQIDAPNGIMLHVGGDLTVRVHVQLGTLTQDDVTVQFYYGTLDSKGEITEPSTLELKPVGSDSRGHIYSGSVACSASGQFGYCVRVLPSHKLLSHSIEPGLIHWS